MENNQQELAEKPKAKQYKSLGAMIKDGAFDVFIKDFPEMQKSGDLKDLFFRLVKNVIHFFRSGVSHGDNVGGDRDNGARQRFFFYDPGVILDIGRSGD